MYYALFFIHKYTLDKLKGQSRMDNPDTQGTFGTHDTRRREASKKQQHNICWTLLYATKDK